MGRLQKWTYLNELLLFNTLNVSQVSNTCSDWLYRLQNESNKTPKTIGACGAIFARLRLAGAAARPKCPKNRACGADTAAGSDPRPESHTHTVPIGVGTPGLLRVLRGLVEYNDDTHADGVSLLAMHGFSCVLV